MASRKITNGPNKFDLMVALFSYNKKHFTFEDPLGYLKTRIMDVGVKNEEMQEWTIAGFVIHNRPLQQFQEFTGTYCVIDRQGEVTFTDTCKECEDPLDDKGFCERCAGGLPLEVCVALRLRLLPPQDASLGLGLTEEEYVEFMSRRSVVLKGRLLRGAQVGNQLWLFRAAEKDVIGRVRITGITTKGVGSSEPSDLEVVRICSHEYVF